jgi:hypothetical protein
MIRLTHVGYEIGVIAAALCPTINAGTGIGLDDLRAYSLEDRRSIAALLGMTDAPQIAAVAPGSPADIAGVKPGDDVLAINDIGIVQLRSTSANASLFADELEQRIAATPIGTSIKLSLSRNGRIFEVLVTPRSVCGTRFVIKTGGGISAFSDGTNVAISSKLIEFASNDDELALIAGHEVGHVINRDGKAGNSGQQRQIEDRADALGVRLAQCAGYDAKVGIEFLLRRDTSDGLRLFRASTHRAAKSRAELMRKEAGEVTCPPTIESTPSEN